MWHHYRCPDRIVVTDNALLVPISAWATQLQTIDLASIRSIHREKIVRGGRYIRSNFEVMAITHAGGRATIRSDWLPSAPDFEEVLSLLKSRVAKHVPALES
jgi:hypothetical protein